MIDDANRVFDGYANLAGGADGGRRANLIGENQCVEAENTIFREGAPGTRPSFLDVALTFQNPDLAYDGLGRRFVNVTNQSVSAFQNGIFQGAGYYAIEPGKQYFMVTIGGRLYQITPGIGQTASVYEVPLAYRNRATLPLNYMVQADIYHITQDGENLPIIFNGVTARRAGIDEIFTGRMMASGMGRIVLVGLDGNIFFGDIYDGQGNGGADMLKFTETRFLNEGFPSRLPPFMGEPRAVQFIPQQDTATGVGECLVFGERGVESFFLSIPREEWKNSAFQRTALLGIGITGHRALTLTNADIGFRSFDGWRTYRQARAEIDKYAHIPLSTNVRKWTEADTRSLLQHCSAITFDQRVLFTCTPYPNTGRVYHNGMLGLDFDVLATFGQAVVNPAWDCHWGNRDLDPLVGLPITQLVEGTFHGEHRAFAFVINEGGDNALVEIQRIPRGSDTGGPITSRLLSKSLDFQSDFNEKRFYGGDLWVDDVKESTEITVRYRPDQVPFFTDWDSFTVDPIDGITEGDALVLRDGYAPRHKLQKPFEEADETGTNRLLSRGFEFQAELTWRGRAVLRKFRAHAQVESEASGPN